METVPYLSVCLNTLNLPLILQNPTNPVTKYLEGLNVIPAEMKLSNGYSLRQHLELLVEANPSQKYLLSKQGYSFNEVKAELLKFQKSGGYFELRDEYKAVGTDFTRPHKYFAGVTETPPAPPTPDQPVLPVALPDKLIEPPVQADQKGSEASNQPAPQTPPQERIRPAQTHVQQPASNPTKEVPKEQPPEPPKPLPQSPSVRYQRQPVVPPPARTNQPSIQVNQSTPISSGPTPTARNMGRPTRIIPPTTIPQPLKTGSLNAASSVEQFVQRAANVTIPRTLGGFVKSAGSAAFGFVPGNGIGRQIAGSRFVRGIGGGGGRGGFVRQVLPVPGNGRSWLLVLLLLLLIVVIFALFFGGAPELSNKADIKNIEITKSGPQAVDNGKVIAYNITVRNKGASPAQVVVSDDIPQNTTYESGNNDPVDSGSGKIVKNIRWTLNSLAGGQSKALTFSVFPTKDDIWVVNQAKAVVTIASGGNVTVPGGNIPPTQDNCQGKWTFKTPLGNYGDPKCDFNKDSLFTLLKQLDPANADYWFYTVVRCESGYDPNNFLGASASGLGAYGLYQMNPGGKGNGQYDAGDVIWQLQSSNAVNYNNELARKWRYWACAQDRW